MTQSTMAIAARPARETIIGLASRHSDAGGVSRSRVADMA
jgi:hypothetical protein